MVGKDKGGGDAPRIFVLGSFVVACSAKVDRLPGPGESLRAHAFMLEAGGKGFNLAVGAKRLGAAVDGVLAVGDDFFSQLARPALAEAGLPLRMLRVQKGATGSGIGFTDATGENCLAIYPGANLLLSAADIRDARSEISSAQVVLAQFEIGDEPIAEAFRMAREAGALTLLNPSPYRDVAPEILAHTSVLVLNRVEARDMAARLGLADPQAVASGGLDALQLLAGELGARGPETVIVTLGADGALAWRGEGPLLYRPSFVIDVIDTLDAGDAFSAGLAVSLAEGLPLAQCLRRAAACGALASRRFGVLKALPFRAELDEYLSSHEDDA
ncbi:MAG TPA: ribokinase [Bradyrhizobium sp.]|nr:ribokinase [Bradyrhizobium sp.]